jgi:hypothetical protein
MELLLNVFGLDSYGWLVAILLAMVGGLIGMVLWLAAAYNQAKARLHDSTTDSIRGYQKVSESLMLIMNELQNQGNANSKRDEASYKLIEHRLEKVLDAIAALQRDLYRKS